MTKDKCWKGRPHNWEDYDETATHLIKYCYGCKGKRWVARNNVTIRSVPIRVPQVATSY